MCVDKQGWEPAESVASTEPPPRRLNNSVAAMTSDRWDTSERKQQVAAEKSKSYGREPVDRPTFRTHQYNKSAQEREKKHSIASTLTTEKADTMEGRMCVYCNEFFFWRGLGQWSVKSRTIFLYIVIDGIKLVQEIVFFVNIDWFKLFTVTKQLNCLFLL